jgi:phosphate starvation-inducible PhoH-like protein
MDSVELESRDGRKLFGSYFFRSRGCVVGVDEGRLMPEVTISLDSHDEELAVFGSRDQLLRQIRDALRVKILARHGAVRVEGEAERVEQAKQVFERMRALYKRQRTISPGDVAEILDYVLLTPDDQGNGFAPLEIREGNRLVRPRTGGQSRYMRALRDDELVFCVGPAGTGKTYLAVAMAVSWLRKGAIKKIVLVRPAVEAGEHLGFLPGDLEAKINPYLRPLLDALHDLLDYDQIRRYMGNDLIEIAPLAYMRGRTLNDAVIILDEGQNATVPQMKMFLTRMGQNSRIVVTGDTTQVDLPIGVTSGLADAVERLKEVPGIGVVALDKSDIVRHPLVQAIVNAYEAGDSAAGPVREELSASVFAEPLLPPTALP